MSIHRNRNIDSGWTVCIRFERTSDKEMFGNMESYLNFSFLLFKLANPITLSHPISLPKAGDKQKSTATYPWAKTWGSVETTSSSSAGFLNYSLCFLLFTFVGQPPPDSGAQCGEAMGYDVEVRCFSSSPPERKRDPTPT